MSPGCVGQAAATSITRIISNGFASVLEFCRRCNVPLNVDGMLELGADRRSLRVYSCPADIRSKRVGSIVVKEAISGVTNVSTLAASVLLVNLTRYVTERPGINQLRILASD